MLFGDAGVAEQVQAQDLGRLAEHEAGEVRRRWAVDVLAAGAEAQRLQPLLVEDAVDLGPRRASFKAYSASAAMLANATPAGRVQIGSYNIVDDFDQAAEWSKRPPNTNGSFAIAPETNH